MILKGNRKWESCVGLLLWQFRQVTSQSVHSPQFAFTGYHNKSGERPEQQRHSEIPTFEKSHHNYSGIAISLQGETGWYFCGNWGNMVYSGCIRAFISLDVLADSADSLCLWHWSHLLVPSWGSEQDWALHWCSPGTLSTSGLAGTYSWVKMTENHTDLT